MERPDAFGAVMPNMPDWHPLDDASSTPLRSVSNLAGRLVAIYASPDFAVRAAAAHLALAVAEQWAEEGTPVVLADGGFAHPTLHDVLGVPRTQGLAEILLEGGPPAGIIHRSDTPGLRIVLAGYGTSAPLPASAHARLNALCEGFQSRGEILAVFVPLGSQLADWMSAACTDILLLAHESERGRELLPAEESRVRAVVGPPVEPIPRRTSTVTVAPPPPRPKLEPALGGPTPLSTVVASRRTSQDTSSPAPANAPVKEAVDPAPAAPPPRPSPPPQAPPPPPPAPPAPPPPPSPGAGFVIRSRTRTEVEPPPVPAEEPVAAKVVIPPLEQPYVAPRHPPKRRRTAVVLAVSTAAVLVAAALWSLGGAGDSSTPAEATPVAPPPSQTVAGPATVPETTPETAPETPPRPRAEVSPHQRFSWSLAAFPSLAVAESEAARLRRAAPAYPFLIAPVFANGRVHYRLLGGLAADRATLATVRDGLAGAMGANPGEWLEREAPLAFGMGEFVALDSARARVAALAGRGIPAYDLVVDYDDTSVAYRVYSGAYLDAGEAGELLKLLRQGGIADTVLTERRGRFGG
jgi:hypothetical protein